MAMAPIIKKRETRNRSQNQVNSQQPQGQPEGVAGAGPGGAFYEVAADLDEEATPRPSVSVDTPMLGGCRLLGDRIVKVEHNNVDSNMNVS